MVPITKHNKVKSWNMNKRMFGALAWIFVLVLTVYGLPKMASAQDENEQAIISDLDWSPDSSQIAIGIGARKNRAQCISYPNVQFLNVPLQQITSIYNPDSTCSITSVDFSSDGSQLLTTSDSNIQTWNIDTEQRFQDLIGGIRFQHAFWRPDSKIFLVVEAYAIEIRNGADLSEASVRGFISPGRLESKFFTDAAWSSDGNSIASSLTDGTIYIWDTATEDILRTFTAHTVAVGRVIWNAELNLIASGDDSGKILIWNPTTGEIVTELKGHTGAIRDLDWRMDGQQLVSASADNMVRTWDWPSGDMQLLESDQSIWSVAYSPDGSQLAYGGELSDGQDITSHITIMLTENATATPK